MGVPELLSSDCKMAEGPDPSLPSASQTGTRVKEKALPKLLNLLSPVLHSWTSFAIQIGVPVVQVSQIRAANLQSGASDLYICLIQALQWWVANHDNPTYEAIIAVLDPEIGETTPVMNRALAGQVKEFMAKEQRVTVSSTAAISGPIVSSGDPESVEQVEVTKGNLAEIRGKFGDLLEFTCTKLQKKLTGEEVKGKFFKFLLTIFPKEQCVPKSSNLEDIFEAITSHGLWNYWDYYPLEQIIKKFGKNDSDMMERMENYKRALSGFQLITKIKNYIPAAKALTESDEQEASPVNRTPENFKRLSIKWNEQITEYTLEYVKNVWQSLSSRLLLPPLSVLLEAVLEKSVLVVWLIPVDLVPKAIEMARQSTKFFQIHPILEVIIDGECVYKADESMAEEDMERIMPASKQVVKGLMDKHRAAAAPPPQAKAKQPPASASPPFSKGTAEKEDKLEEVKRKDELKKKATASEDSGSGGGSRSGTAKKPVKAGSAVKGKPTREEPMSMSAKEEPMLAQQKELEQRGYNSVMVQRSQLQKTNLAAEAFGRHYAVLHDALAQPHMASELARKLYNGAIITSETREAVQFTPGITPRLQADLILHAVESSINTDYTRLRKFTRVLKKVLVLQPIAKQLRRCYRELVSEAESSSSESDTDPTEQQPLQFQAVMVQKNQLQKTKLALEAFGRYDAVLYDALVQPHMASELATQLYNGAIITSETREAIQFTPGITPRLQADLLLHAVESSINTDYTRLRKFIRVLKKVVVLKPIAKQLRRCYSELISEAESSSSESDTDPTQQQPHEKKPLVPAGKTLQQHEEASQESTPKIGHQLGLGSDEERNSQSQPMQLSLITTSKPDTTSTLPTHMQPSAPPSTTCGEVNSGRSAAIMSHFHAHGTSSTFEGVTPMDSTIMKTKDTAGVAASFVSPLLVQAEAVEADPSFEPHPLQWQSGADSRTAGLVELVCPVCQAPVADDNFLRHWSTECREYTHIVPHSKITDTAPPILDITANEFPLSLKSLSVELTPVTDWYKLGISLGLKRMKLRVIESRNPGPKQCKLDVLDTWLQTHPHPSWRLIVDALYEIGEDSVAERLKQEYYPVSELSEKEKENTMTTDVNLLQGRFQNLLQEVCSHLARNVRKEEISVTLQVVFASLPSGYANLVPQASNLSELIEVLSQNELLDFWNYFLLEHMMDIFQINDPELASKMEQYKKERSQFQVATDFILPAKVSESHHRTVKQNHKHFVQLLMKVNNCIADASLCYIDRLHEMLASYLSLPQFALLFHAVIKEGMYLVWYVPTSIVHSAQEALRNIEFYIPEILSVKIDDKFIYQRRSQSADLLGSQSRLQSAPSGQVGYDCKLIGRPLNISLQTNCPLCVQILRAPCLTSCCRTNFCQNCICTVKEAGRSCPGCNEVSYDIKPNKEVENLLKDLRVQCCHYSSGCEWTGKLAHYEQHLNLSPSPENRLEGCEFVEIECVYNCDNQYQRHLLDKHEKEECFMRPYNCEYCHDYSSIFLDVVYIHWKECRYFPVHCRQNCGLQSIERQNLKSHIDNECPLTVVKCDFHYAGCEELLPRKDMAAHLADAQSAYLSGYQARRGMHGSHYYQSWLNHTPVIPILSCEELLPRKDMAAHLADARSAYLSGYQARRGMHGSHYYQSWLHQTPVIPILTDSQLQSPSTDESLKDKRIDAVFSNLRVILPEQQAGYDCKIMESPFESDSIQKECPICLNMLRNPQRLTCCGYSYCKVCIDNWEEIWRCCPTCKEEVFSIVPNKLLKTSLNQHTILCPYEGEGCEWIGKLVDLDEHLNESPKSGEELTGCEFVQLQCTHCGEYLQRRYITPDHMNMSCFQQQCHEAYQEAETPTDEHLYSKAFKIATLKHMVQQTSLAALSKMFFHKLAKDDMVETFYSKMVELDKFNAVKAQSSTATAKAFYVNVAHLKMENETLKKSIREKDEEITWLRRHKQLFIKQNSRLVPTLFQLPGVDFMDVSRTRVYGSKEMQSIKYHGFKMHIPALALPESEECEITVATCMSGAFVFPPQTTLMNSVYYIQSSRELPFHFPVTIELEHCCDLYEHTANGLVFATVVSSTKEPPFVFTTNRQGNFSPDSSFGQLSASNFSFFTILWDRRDYISKLKSTLEGTLIHNSNSQCRILQPPSLRYFARVYYRCEGKTTWKVILVITKNLQTCSQAVKELYQDSYQLKELTSFDVRLDPECDCVCLDGLESSGNMTNNGCWKIWPAYPPQMRRCEIDNFLPGKLSPAKCELNVRWLKDREPLTPLEYTLNLKGAEPTYFNIMLDPNQQDLPLRRSDTTECFGVGPDTYTEIDESDILDVSSYLLELEKTHIYNLGLALGLSQRKVKAMEESRTFLDDILSAWIRKEDYVEKNGNPSWGTLVEALRHRRLNQNGLAKQIIQERPWMIHKTLGQYRAAWDDDNDDDRPGMTHQRLGQSRTTLDYGDEKSDEDDLLNYW